MYTKYQMALEATFGNFNVMPAFAGMTGLVGQSLCGLA
jgi:hypothetical protein